MFKDLRTKFHIHWILLIGILSGGIGISLGFAGADAIAGGGGHN